MNVKLGFEKLKSTYIFFKYYVFRKSTNNLMVYFQFGRCPLYVQRKLYKLKYCCGLLKTNICILQSCEKKMQNEYEKKQLENVKTG